MIAGGGFPAPEPNPLVINEIEIPHFWRKKRIVVVEENRVTEELKKSLDSKGVRLFVLPEVSERRSQFFEGLKTALKD